MKTVPPRVLVAVSLAFALAAPSWSQDSQADDLGDSFKQAKQAAAEQARAAAGAKPEEVRAAGASEASACRVKDAFNQAASPSDFEGKYRYWTGAQGDTYYCVFGDKFLHAPGYLSSIREASDELLITIVVASRGQTAGITLVRVEDVSNGRASVEIPHAARKAELEINSVMTYRLKKDSLKKLAGSPRPVELDKTAWLSERHLGQDPALLDSVKVLTHEDGKERAAQVVAMLEKLDARQSGLFGGASNGENRKKLKKFLDAAIDKDRGQNDPDAPAHALIMLNLNDANRDVDVAIYNDRSRKEQGLQWIAPMDGAPHLQDPR